MKDQDEKKLASEGEGKNPEYQKYVDSVNKEFENFVEIPLPVEIVLGQRHITVREFLALDKGSIIDMKRSAGESLLIFCGRNICARGEVMIIEETFAVRVTDVVDPRKV